MHTPSIAFRQPPPRKDVVNQCLEFGTHILCSTILMFVWPPLIWAYGWTSEVLDSPPLTLLLFLKLQASVHHILHPVDAWCLKAMLSVWLFLILSVLLPLEMSDECTVLDVLCIRMFMWRDRSWWYQQRESYRRRLRSLLLCACVVFKAPTD